MLNWLNLFWMLMSNLIEEHYIKENEFLRVQLQIALDHLPKQIKTTPQERKRLLEAGLPLGDTLKESIYIVQPQTFQRWNRLMEKGKVCESSNKRGRRRIGLECRSLIKRFASENVNWGYTRIMSELKKLGSKVGRTSVKRILHEEGVSPAPDRAGKQWKYFIERHMDSLWATDFSSVIVQSVFGPRYIFFLFFIHVETRRVYYAGCTEHPNSAWVEQHARQFCWFVEEEGIKAEVLIHDRDAKYTKKFDSIMQSEGITPKRLPVRAPNLNSYAEAWCGSLKRECLNHFIIFGRKHLDYLIHEYVDYYNHERPQLIKC